jgi:prepilin-type N-terminal cleavage/methylation domain-containing protein
MKNFFIKGRPGRRERALTLVEMMVSMAVFSLAVTGMVYTYLFTLSQDELTNSKLGASDQSRIGFDTLVNNMRTAKIWQVGNGNQSSFTPIPNGTAQIGNALQISLTTATNTYYLYYFNTNNGQLYQCHSGVAGSTLLAQYLTNSMYFLGEDYQGNVLTNITHKGVIHLMMQFCQYQYPLTRVGPGYYYDSYEMDFRVCSHVPDGP